MRSLLVTALVVLSSTSIAEVVVSAVNQTGFDISGEDAAVTIDKPATFLSIRGQNVKLDYTADQNPEVVVYNGQLVDEDVASFSNEICAPLIIAERNNSDGGAEVRFFQARSDAEGCERFSLADKHQQLTGVRIWQQDSLLVKTRGDKNLSIDKKSAFLHFQGIGNIVKIQKSTDLDRLHISPTSINNKFIIDAGLKDKLSIADFGSDTEILYFDFSSELPLPI